MSVYIDEGIELEFFKLDEAFPDDREMVTLVLKPNTISIYMHEVSRNKAGNQIISASTRLFKKVPPKFTIRTHYETIDVKHDDVLYWGRIKKDI